MKFLWLITLFFSLAMGSNFQIVIANYKLQKNALIAKKELQTFLQKKKVFFTKYAIKSNIEKSEDFYILTLEPFKDFNTLQKALTFVKINYQDAYVIELSPSKKNKIELESNEKIEPTTQKDNKLLMSAELPTIQEVIDNTADNTTLPKIQLIKESVKNIATTQKKETFASPQEMPPLEEEVNFLPYIIIAFFVLVLITLLLILFMITKSNKKQKKLQIIQMKNDKKKISQLLEKNEINKTKSSDLKKRALLAHGKITKQDFQDFSGTKILLAEDNTINQKVIQGLLAESGIEILIANNGKEALDILQKDTNITLVIMDIHMPILDGFEATRIIRRNPLFSHIPIIALSGDVSDCDIKKMLSVGMNAHLEKPLRMDTFYDVFQVYAMRADDNISQKTIAKEILNIKNGLIICLEDVSFYREILSDFLASYQDSDNKIFEYLHTNNFSFLQKYLFDLLGVSANIGADELHDIIKEMKEAIFNKKEQEYLPLAEKYSLSLQKLKKSILEYS